MIPMNCCSRRLTRTTSPQRWCKGSHKGIHFSLKYFNLDFVIQVPKDLCLWLTWENLSLLACPDAGASCPFEPLESVEWRCSRDAADLLQRSFRNIFFHLSNLHIIHIYTSTMHYFKLNQRKVDMKLIVVIFCTSVLAYISRVESVLIVSIYFKGCVFQM